MFQLDPQSKASIYEQVVDYMKKMMITQVLKADDKLPSVREFSKAIMVNPNTVSKAYKELERQGFTYTISGKGTFVAKREMTRDPKQVETLLTRIYERYKELRYLGYGQDDALTLMDDFIRRRDAHDSH